MAKAACSDDEFIALFETLGPIGAARELKVVDRAIFSRRRNIETRLGRTLQTPTQRESSPAHSARLDAHVWDGTVIVGSDAHYWPGRVTTAHRAFVKFCKDLQPNLIVMNGDVFDGASVSRHSPIGWETRPTVIEEIDACKERLGEIEAACTAAQKVWTLGNHDSRFETRLATVAPEYAKVAGVHLKDHFPLWQPSWSIWVNKEVVIKHRYKGGVHATHNNTLNAGKTMVTGHLHSLKVTPYADYNGNRFGVDTGTLAEPYGPQFLDYCEDGPLNWRSGFVVLTFVAGRLMWPEVVHVIEDGKVEFRGTVIGV